MGSILEVFPQPKTINLGGQRWVVTELRISDLAKLHELLVQSFPHPIEELREKLIGSEGRERQKNLMRLQLQMADYPPQYPSFIADLFFRTAKGAAQFFMLVLGRDNEIAVPTVLQLIETITEAERIVLDKTLWGVGHDVEIRRLFFPVVDSSGKPTKPDWTRICYEIIKETGLTFEQIGELRISQFHALRTGSGREVSLAEDWTHLPQEERVQRYGEQRDLLQEIKDEDGTI